MRRYASRGAVAASALALCLPAAAFGQSAGDEQYQDPFANDERAQTGSGGGGNGNGTGSGAGTQGGGGELSTSPPEGSEEQAAQTRTPAGELPRTGADPGLIALLGAGFVLTGAGLRVRVRRPLA